MDEFKKEPWWSFQPLMIKIILVIGGIGVAYLGLSILIIIFGFIEVIFPYVLGAGVLIYLIVLILDRFGK